MKWIIVSLMLILFIAGCGSETATTTSTVASSTTLAEATTTSTTTTTTSTTTTIPERIPDLMQTKESESYTIADYPGIFEANGNFNALIVTGTSPKKVADVAVEIQSATSIMSGLSSCCNIPVGSNVLDSEVSDSMLSSRDMLLLGSPCSNSVIAKIIGTSKENCDSSGLNLQEGKCLLKLYEKDSRKYLLVLGISAAETKLGAKVLEGYDNYDLDGSTIEITGTTSSPVVRVLN